MTSTRPDTNLTPSKKCNQGNLTFKILDFSSTFAPIHLPRLSPIFFATSPGVLLLLFFFFNYFIIIFIVNTISFSLSLK